MIKEVIIKSCVNPRIVVGDTVRLNDGSSLSTENYDGEELLIVYAYPSLTGDTHRLMDIECKVLSIEEHKYMMHSNAKEMVNVYRQDLIVSCGNLILRISSNHVVKLMEVKKDSDGCFKRKTEVLFAAKKTLEEYRANKHRSLCSTCEVCRLAKSIADEKNDKQFCNYCMMFPFGSAGDGSYCIKRKCRVVDHMLSSLMTPDLRKSKLKKVTLFWERVVRKLEQMPDKFFVENWYKMEWWQVSVKRFDELSYSEVESEIVK